MDLKGLDIKFTSYSSKMNQLLKFGVTICQTNLWFLNYCCLPDMHKSNFIKKKSLKSDNFRHLESGFSFFELHFWTLDLSLKRIEQKQVGWGSLPPPYRGISNYSKCKVLEKSIMKLVWTGFKLYSSKNTI